MPGSQHLWYCFRGTGLFLPVQSPGHFPVDHTSMLVFRPCKDRVLRYEPATCGQDGVPVTVQRQVDHVRVGGTHTPGRVLPWRVRPVLSLVG